MNIIKVQLSLCEGEKEIQRYFGERSLEKIPHHLQPPPQFPSYQGRPSISGGSLAAPDSLHQQGPCCVLPQISTGIITCGRSLSQTRVSF